MDRAACEGRGWAIAHKGGTPITIVFKRNSKSGRNTDRSNKRASSNALRA